MLKLPSRSLDYAEAAKQVPGSSRSLDYAEAA